MPKKLRITLARSLAGRPPDQRATARALGLSKRGKTVIHKDHPSIRGMIRKITHLVTVEEIEEG